MINILFLVIGVLCGFILGFYMCAKGSHKILSTYVHNHRGEEISNETLVNILADERKLGDFIHVTKAESYMKEHDGEDISIGSIIEDDEI